MYTLAPEEGGLRKQLSLKNPRLPGSPHAKKLLSPGASSLKSYETRETIFEIILKKEAKQITTESQEVLSPTSEESKYASNTLTYPPPSPA